MSCMSTFSVSVCKREVGIQLSLPSSAEAEELLLQLGLKASHTHACRQTSKTRRCLPASFRHGVERLAEALPAGKSGAAFAAFYKSYSSEMCACG